MSVDRRICPVKFFPGHTMVMKDKSYDLLETIFLGENIDLSEVLTPEREVLSFPTEIRSEEENGEEFNFDGFIMEDTEVTLDDDNFMIGEVIIDDSCVPMSEVVEIEPEICLDDESAVYPETITILSATEPAGCGIYPTLELEDDTSSDPSWSPEPASKDTEYGIPQALEFIDTSSNQSWSPGPLTPIVKEELKYTIQSRRMGEGKQELTVEFPEPEPEKLTPEEEKRREERRLKNKLAAQKCRNKKREKADVLEEETKKLASKQKKLKIDIKKLLDEREHLQELLDIHKSVCPKLRKTCKSK